MDFQKLLDSDKVLYRYITGSHLYHCEEEGSDVDTKGLYMADINDLMGLGFDKSFRDRHSGKFELYTPQVNDERNDNVIYEVGKFMGMLLSSNANVLESLYVPEDMMIVKPHKCLATLFANRDNFLTKDCFHPFIQYSMEQIKKARGLNKKIVNPIVERKGVLDFVYTFYNQGSTNIKNWLEYRGLKQEYCGLVNIPNMKGVLGLYYDWGNFFMKENITFDKIRRGCALIGKLDSADIVSKIKSADNADKKAMYEKILKDAYISNMVKFIIDFYEIDGKDCDSQIDCLERWYHSNVGIHKTYKGMVGENSQELRLSSVSKGEKPICHISYNADGYSKHCIDYRNYKEWERERNPRRYESNLNKNYDSKNMYHSVRLIHMGIEIANGDGIILDRREAGDAELLKKIRQHGFEYDELMEIIEKDEQTLNKVMAESKLNEHIDVNLVNDILIDMRKKYYGLKTYGLT